MRIQVSHQKKTISTCNKVPFFKKQFMFSYKNPTGELGLLEWAPYNIPIMVYEKVNLMSPVAVIKVPLSQRRNG